MDTKEKPKKIIEVVGPAGAGKSTLAKILCRHDGVQLISSPPYARRLSDLSFFARNTLDLMPTILIIHFSNIGNGLSRRDMAWMATLMGWHRVLDHASTQNSILLLDEGPIYYMAYLQIYGSGVLGTLSAQAWWDQIYKKWSRKLDMVVHLDAPDIDLIARIRARDKSHGVKIKPDQYAFKYLADLREKYEYLLAKLTTEDPNLNILQFDTHQLSLDQVCAEVIAKF